MTHVTACAVVVFSAKRFTGKERDSESGLDYFGARYYGSGMGRFTSPDPKILTSRHLTSPQKWNKYTYVQNNPLISIDPDGQDDIFVFRPTATSTSSAWRAAQADAKKNGNTVTIYNGKDATSANYVKALQTPDSHVVFAGHSVEQTLPAGGAQAGSVLLNDKAVGTTGQFANPDGSGGIIPPAATPDISASTVGVFACRSDDLAPQYSGTIFTGVSGNEYIPSLDVGAAAYTDVLVKNGTVDQADAAAQRGMAARDRTVIDKDKLTTPKVVKHDDQ